MARRGVKFETQVLEAWRVSLEIALWRNFCFALAKCEQYLQQSALEQSRISAVGPIVLEIVLLCCSCRKAAAGVIELLEEVLLP